MEVKEEIEQFLEKRPNTVCAFGYGSGVFRQSGYSSSDKPQIDLILAVEDIRMWHLENMKKNPGDYSFTGKVFYSNASKNTIKGFNGITYQSNIKQQVDNETQMFKYGVIEVSDLEHQLKSWNRFYLAGRFHKNILKIKCNKNMDELIDQNRKYALITALYFLPDESTLTELYEKIVGLSFIGDTRMRFFENPNKIKNIVSKAKDEFDALYAFPNPFFEIVEGERIRINRKEVMSEPLPAYLAYSLTELPKDDLQKLRDGIENFLKEKNKCESTKQTIHGLSTNGILRSSNYVFQKLKKRIYKK